MWKFSLVFALPMQPKWDFRIRWSARFPSWVNAVSERQAFLERCTEGGQWVEFMVIREGDTAEMLKREDRKRVAT